MIRIHRHFICAISVGLMFGLVFCQAVMAATPKLPPPASPSYDNSAAVKLWAFFGVFLGILVMLSIYYLVLAIFLYSRATSQGSSAAQEAAKTRIIVSGVVVLVLSIGTGLIFYAVAFASQFLPGA